MLKAAMVLSGCGVYDGSEIHEAVITYYMLDKKGVKVSFFAPDMEQQVNINHLKKESCEEKRNVLVESARIARSNIKDIKELNVKDFDMIVYPGGSGAVKNLSDYASKGKDLNLIPEVEKIIKEAAELSIIQGFVCIAPVLAAKACSNMGKSVKITIGNDERIMKKVEGIACNPIAKNYDEYCHDEELKIFSTPAYMLAQSISQIAEGIEKMIDAMIASK